MVVKLITLDIHCPGCSSLKEKRFVVSSIKARLRNRFNVSVAEVSWQDKWQRAGLAVVVVANGRAGADSVGEGIVRFVERDPRVQLADVEQEWR